MNFLLSLKLVECPHPPQARNAFVQSGADGILTTHLCMDCGSWRIAQGEFPRFDSPTWRPWRRPRLAQTIALDMGVKT